MNQIKGNNIYELTKEIIKEFKQGEKSLIVYLEDLKIKIRIENKYEPNISVKDDFFYEIKGNSFWLDYYSSNYFLDDYNEFTHFNYMYLSMFDECELLMKIKLMMIIYNALTRKNDMADLLILVYLKLKMESIDILRDDYVTILKHSVRKSIEDEEKSTDDNPFINNIIKSRIENERINISFIRDEIEKIIKNRLQIL